LSGGQQQRVSIARVFAKKPKIIFADEPTGAVDNSMSDTILNAFSEMNKKYNITIILVTHNPEIASLATKVVYFKDGYIERMEEQ
ncbi:MAG: ATP-binding cassette domain-containing protein, partial [Mycoplasma sp.]